MQKTPSYIRANTVIPFKQSCFGFSNSCFSLFFRHLLRNWRRKEHHWTVLGLFGSADLFGLCTSAPIWNSGWAVSICTRLYLKNDLDGFWWSSPLWNLHRQLDKRAVVRSTTLQALSNQNKEKTVCSTLKQHPGAAALWSRREIIIMSLTSLGGGWMSLLPWQETTGVWRL